MDSLDFQWINGLSRIKSFKTGATLQPAKGYISSVSLCLSSLNSRYSKSAKIIVSNMYRYVYDTF